MTSRAWTRPLVALLLLAGCHAYMPSAAPLAPGTETVRLAFARPQAVVLARGDGAGASVDTIADATAIYGRVVELRDDTLRMVVTQVARRGTLRYLPSGADATLATSTVAGVERWSHSPERTTVLVSIVAGAAVAVLSFLWALGEMVEG